MMTEEKVLTLNGLVTYDGQIKGKILSECANSVTEAKAYTDELKNGQVETNKTSIGTLGDLNTSYKSNLVGAINEVFTAIGTGGTSSVVSVEKDESGLIYTIKQGGSPVGTIDIPKDMVVSSGTVEVLEDEDTSGNPPGTYLVLTLANATKDKIYINVGKLVDIYKAKSSATQIQIVIDSETREISATLVANSVTTTELADNAITTSKIVDANVTKAKLETSIQTSLDKLDTKLQQSDITTGISNGTFKVKDSEISIAGLKSAAYVETSSFDSAGTASNLVAELENGQVTTNKNDISNIKSRLSSLEENTYTPISEEEISALFS